MTPLLAIKNADVFYGPIHALKQISIEVAEGSIVALLGANGAGKSTTLRSVSGLLKLAAGQIDYAGNRIDRLPEEKIARLGISHVPEGRQIFASLTTLENLQIGGYGLKSKKELERNLARCYDYFPILRERGGQLAQTLSGGEQQMLAIARGLMSSPKLLLLDEPSLGLAPLIVKSIMAIVRTIAAEGVTILIVEQNVSQTLKVADFAYVLEVGRIIASGPAAELARDPALIEAYLGGKGNPHKETAERFETPPRNEQTGGQS